LARRIYDPFGPDRLAWEHNGGSTARFPETSEHIDQVLPAAEDRIKMRELKCHELVRGFRRRIHERSNVRAGGNGFRQGRACPGEPLYNLGNVPED
jgi:hypothetical protein